MVQIYKITENRNHLTYMEGKIFAKNKKNNKKPLQK